MAPVTRSYGTGQKHWLHLLKARAIENQCFVLAPNQVGTAPNKFRSWGHSLILDPWGDVRHTLSLSTKPFTRSLTRALRALRCHPQIVAEGGDGEEIVYGKLDLSLLSKYREALPSLKHIRKDIFHV
jgi:nitrilase